jgi:hypothetical protein
MSTNDSSDPPKSKVFSSQEFLEFLAKQVDISKLTVVTKSGDKISASFNGIMSASGDESVFKSLDALKSLDSSDDAVKPAISQSTVSLEYSKGPPSSKLDAFTSKDWQIDYEKEHVDVTYGKCFSNSASQKAPRIPSSSALPPKKRPSKTDWYGMYADALSPLVEAAALAEPQPVGNEEEMQIESASSKKPAAKETKPLSKQSKRKPRKIIPEIKDYVDEYVDHDVLFGRGGRSNHHPGNKIYRDFVIDKQPYYRSCDKNEKTKVAQSIVDSINKEYNGRFLELEKGTERWYVVPNIVARRKVGQALRENNTELARAAKREKYGQGKPKKAGEDGTISSVDHLACALATPPAAIYSAAV